MRERERERESERERERERDITQCRIAGRKLRQTICRVYQVYSNV